MKADKLEWFCPECEHRWFSGYWEDTCPGCEYHHCGDENCCSGFPLNFRYVVTKDEEKK